MNRQLKYAEIWYILQYFFLYKIKQIINNIHQIMLDKGELPNFF